MERKMESKGAKYESRYYNFPLPFTYVRRVCNGPNEALLNEFDPV